jgi:hypothetical protein
MDGVDTVSVSFLPTEMVTLCDVLSIQAMTVMGLPVLITVMLSWSTLHPAEAVLKTFLGAGVGTGVGVIETPGVGVILWLSVALSCPPAAEAGPMHGIEIMINRSKIEAVLKNLCTLIPPTPIERFLSLISIYLTI